MILHITNYANRGGGTKVARALLAAHKNEATILALERTLQSSSLVSTEPSIVISHWKDWRHIRAVIADCHRKAGTNLLIHSHGRIPGLYSRMARALGLLETKVVHTFHGAISFEGPRRLATNITESLLSLLGHAVVFVSSSERAGFRPLRPLCREKVILPCFDPENVVAILPRAIRRIGFAARFEYGKLHSVLIEAVALHNSRAGDPLQLILAGDGSTREQIDRLGQDLLGEQYVSLGYAHDMKNFYAGLDVYVQSTMFEGLPLALLDAMACGLPVIGTDVPGNRDLISHDLTGLLVRVGDKYALASALSELQRSHNAAWSLGGRAREVVHDQYGCDRMVASYDELYRSVGYRFGA